MALILPDVPALRLRLSRLWSRVSQLHALAAALLAGARACGGPDIDGDAAWCPAAQAPAHQHIAVPGRRHRQPARDFRPARHRARRLRIVGAAAPHGRRRPRRRALGLQVAAASRRGSGRGDRHRGDQFGGCHHVAVLVRRHVDQSCRHADVAPDRLVCHRPRAAGDRRAGSAGESLQAPRDATDPVRSRFAAVLRQPGGARRRRQGSDGPGTSRQSRAAAPAVRGRQLRGRAERPERRRDPDVRGHHGRGIRRVVVGPAGLHLRPAGAGRRRRCDAPAAQPGAGRPRRGDHGPGVREAGEGLLVGRDAGRLHHRPGLRDGRHDRHGVHLLCPVPDHPLLPSRIRHPEEPGLRLVVLPLHDRPDRRGHHHAGLHPLLHAGTRGLRHHGSGHASRHDRWACARWWWRWWPA